MVPERGFQPALAVSGPGAGSCCGTAEGDAACRAGAGTGAGLPGGPLGTGLVPFFTLRLRQGSA